jgi:putative FmdB family regulatory protein
MPTYEYECKSCGYSFEAFQSMSEAPLSDCPQCGREVRRLINGGSGVIFKGSGFYVTDKKGAGGTASASTKPEGGAVEKTGQTAEKAEKAGPAPAAQPDPAAKERKGGTEKKAAS